MKITPFPISPDDPQPDDNDLPHYSDPGRILFLVHGVYEDEPYKGEVELEIFDFDGSVFWINEGVGCDYWLGVHFAASDFPFPGWYVVEGITGYYHRGTFGFDDDTEDWEFTALRPATADEITGECLISTSSKPS